MVAPPSSAAPAALLAGVDLHPRRSAEALIALSTVADRLRRRGDPRAAFPDIYAVVTRHVGEALQRDATFLEPAFVDRLGGRFAELYFEALVPVLAGGAPRWGAWRVAMGPGRTTLPVREALLGVNAHVNADLARGIVDVVRGFGHTRDARRLARYRHDHDAINHVLQGAIVELMTTLRDRHGCPAARLATRDPHGERALVAAFSALVTRWRTRVWHDVTRLLAAPHDELVLPDIDRRSARIARALALGR